MEYSPTRSSGGPSAKAWEEGLDALAQSTDENLNKLRQFRNTEFKPQQQSQTTIVMKPSGFSQRPSSAPRDRGNATPKASQRPNTAFNNTSKEQIDFITTTTSSLGPGGSDADRKIDLLLKRTKATEDKLKKLQADNMSLLEAKNISDLMVEQLCESVKSDRQLIMQLEGQVQDAVKGMREGAAVGRRAGAGAPLPNSSGIATAADIEGVQEVVYQRVHKEFNKIVSEVVRTCAAEQSLFLQKWSDQQESQSQRKTVNTGKVVESELARHKSDVLVLQGKLREVEGQVADLKGALARKDAEGHRKVMNAFRAESQSVLESVGRKVNEALAAANKNSLAQSQNESSIHKSIAFQGQQLKQLQSWKGDINEHLGRSEDMMTRALEHIQRLDDTAAGAQEQLDQCSGYISQVMQQAAEAERSSQQAAETVSRFVASQQQSQQQSQQHGSSSPLSSSMNGQQLQQLESRIGAALESFNSSRKSMQALIDTLHVSMGKLERDVLRQAQTADARHEETSSTAQHLMESGKKLKNKVQEIITSLNSLSSQTRQVDSKLAEGDAAYGQVAASTQGLEQRVARLERGAMGANGGGHSPSVLMSPTPQLFSPPGSSRGQGQDQGQPNSALLDNYQRKLEQLEREKASLRSKYEELLSVSGGPGIQSMSVNKPPNPARAAAVPAQAPVQMSQARAHVQAIDHNDYYSPTHAQHLQQQQWRQQQEEELEEEEEEENEEEEEENFGGGAGYYRQNSDNSEPESAAIHASASPLRPGAASSRGHHRSNEEEEEEEAGGSMRASMEDWLDQQLYDDEDSPHLQQKQQSQKHQSQKHQSQQHQSQKLQSEKHQSQQQSQQQSPSGRDWQPATVRSDSRPAPLSMPENAAPKAEGVSAARGWREDKGGAPTHVGSPLEQKVRDKKSAQQSRRELFLKKAQAEFEQREY